jgi:hypothetical protein
MKHYIADDLYLPSLTAKRLLLLDTNKKLTALGAGTNGQVLIADSSEPLGVRWDDASGGGGLEDWSEADGHLLPDADDTQDIGSSAFRVRTLFGRALDLTGDIETTGRISLGTGATIEDDENAGGGIKVGYVRANIGLIRIGPQEADGVLSFASGAFEFSHKLFLPHGIEADGILVRDFTSTVVSDTTTATTILEHSIPGGILTNKVVRVRLSGSYINNSGGAATLEFRIAYGGTNILRSTLVNASTGSNTRAWLLEFWLVGSGSSAQELNGWFAMSAASGSVVEGYGGASAAPTMASNPFGGTGTINSASAQNIRVQVVHGTAHADISINKRIAFIEVM